MTDKATKIMQGLHEALEYAAREHEALTTQDGRKVTVEQFGNAYIVRVKEDAPNDQGC